MCLYLEILKMMLCSVYSLSKIYVKNAGCKHIHLGPIDGHGRMEKKVTSKPSKDPFRVYARDLKIVSDERTM